MGNDFRQEYPWDVRGNKEDDDDDDDAGQPV